MLNIKINQPYAIHAIGKRANNEDNIYPSLADKATMEQRYFLVCDGVGGAEKGEVASLIACLSYSEFFKKNSTDLPDDTYLEQALQFVQAQFDKQLEQDRSYQGMATTMTLLYLHHQGATIAHIGDSRVYHIRDGEILFCTRDHSLVNQLIAVGVLAPEEAATHPQRNVITRAIQGSQKRTKADVKIITDIQAGDYFFLCTDGILESIEDELLVQILNDPDYTNEDKIDSLKTQCQMRSRDNYSAYLIQIAAVEQTSAPLEVEAAVFIEEEIVLVGEVADTEKTQVEQPLEAKVIEPAQKKSTVNEEKTTLENKDATKMADNKKSKQGFWKRFLGRWNIT